MAKGNFFSELKRRNVYRVGAAYAVAAFVLIEIVSNVAPILDFPGWIGRAVILLLVVGFPVVLCFAWIYEITPDGVKRTAEVEQDVSVTHQTGHRLNIVIIALMVVLAGLYGADRFLLRGDAADAANISASSRSQTPAGSISIAVLPFVNLSGDPGQEFFSDGMTEEITSALAKVTGLQVVGRTSAFEFKGQNKDLRAIGKALGASHLLEGSVRKSGSRLRITGQLIKADNGTHLWTENYDRELTDIFATQDDIARAIAAALLAPLGLKAGETLVVRDEIAPENYQIYLRAKALYRSRGTNTKSDEAANFEEAISLLEGLVVAQPQYAPGWALLAAVYHRSPQFIASRDFELMYAKARATAQRAIDLDPRNAEAYAVLGSAQPTGQMLRQDELVRHALDLDPSNPDVMFAYGNILTNTGRLREAVALRKKLIAIEPLVPVFNATAALTLWADGQYEAALVFANALPMSFRGRWTDLAVFYASMGRYAEAADIALKTPTDVLASAEAAATARLLRMAPAKVPQQELPTLKTWPWAYIYVGAPERVFLVDAPGSILIGWANPSWGPLRRTPGFKTWARYMGLVEYWRARGWPDMCRPVGADAFECS